MSLEDEIKKEEEELAKLEEAEQEENKEEESQDDVDTGKSDDSEDEDEENDDDNEDSGSDDDGEAEEDTDDADTEDDADSDGDDDSDDGEDTADNKHKSVKDENNAAAKARVERRKRLKAEAEAADLRERLQKQNEAQREPTTEERAEAKQETTEERLDRLETERANERLQVEAAEELSDIEDEFVKENPDYKQASAHMIKSMFQGVRQVYPNMSEKQAIKFLQNKVLEIAGSAANRGQNPAEVLYQMAFDNYGFDPAKAAEEKKGGEDKPTFKKTGAAENLKKKARNKKRSANGLSGGGQNAGARVTIEEADKMTLADFGAMSDKDIDELIAQADS